MVQEVLSDWLVKAKSVAPVMADNAGVRVIRREESKGKGAVILEVADKIRPWLSKMFEGVRDENYMLVQPSRVHGIALNVAKSIVNSEEKKQKKASA